MNEARVSVVNACTRAPVYERFLRTNIYWIWYIRNGTWSRVAEHVPRTLPRLDPENDRATFTRRRRDPTGSHALPSLPATLRRAAYVTPPWPLASPPALPQSPMYPLPPSSSSSSSFSSSLSWPPALPLPARPGGYRSPRESRRRVQLTARLWNVYARRAGDACPTVRDRRAHSISHSPTLRELAPIVLAPREQRSSHPRCAYVRARTTDRARSRLRAVVPRLAAPRSARSPPPSERRFVAAHTLDRVRDSTTTVLRFRIRPSDRFGATRPRSDVRFLSLSLSPRESLAPTSPRGKEFPRPKEDAEVLNDLKYVTNFCSFPHPCSSLLSFFFLFPPVSLALSCLLVLLYRFHNITLVLSRSLVAGHTLPTNVRPSKNGATALGTSRAGERRGRRATRFAGGHVSPARPTNRRTD